VLGSSVIDHGFEARSVRAKYNENVAFLHTALRRKSKDWLDQNHSLTDDDTTFNHTHTILSKYRLNIRFSWLRKIFKPEVKPKDQ